jgi:hypothetical protein
MDSCSHAWYVSLHESVQVVFNSMARVNIHVKRVATDMNIADLPTRDSFELLHSMGDVEVPPILTNSYRQQQAWEVLCERWQM